jgi:aryl-alcohol dehydrogenase-like predicted oxidoreductase
MLLSSLTRRQVLVSGALGMTGLASAGALRAAAAAATPASASAPGAARAAAAGSLRLGGDLTVNRMGFGAMRITGAGIWGEPQDPAEARRVLHRVVELGVNFIDTADAYGPEVSERLIAEALYPYPPGLVIATKGGMLRPSASQWTADGRPQHLRAACEASLRRLKLARIDLYQLHRIDPNVPLEDSIGELSRLRQAGKIRHVGVSNFGVAELARAQRIVPIVSVQNRYNIADRSSEAVLNACAQGGLTFIPWAPLARGSADALEGRSSGALEKVAGDHGVSVVQVAIAWLLAKSPAMLPIPGTSSVAHLEQNVAAADLRLSATELAAIG